LPKLISENICPFIFVVRIKKERKDFIAHCKKNGIDTGIHWQPGHLFSFFKNCHTHNLDVTNNIAKEIVTLPMYPCLTEEQINLIVNVVNSF
jgi:dTDP-4-amino-4,6-dideoxygalactose transaminase